MRRRLVLVLAAAALASLLATASGSGRTGGTIAAVLRDRDGDRIELSALDGSRRATVRLPAGTTATAPAWSPSGESVALVVHDGHRSSVAVLDAARAGLVRLAPADAASRLAWRPAGDALAVTRGDGVHLVSLAGRRDRRLVAARGALDAELSWSPGGRRLAVASHGSECERGRGRPGAPARLLVVDVASGAVRRVAPLVPAAERARSWLVVWRPRWTADGSRLVYAVDEWDRAECRAYSPPTALMAVAAAGGAPVVVARGSSTDGLDWGSLRGLDTAPEGDGVVWSDGTGVYTVHVRSAAKPRLLQELSSAGAVAWTTRGILAAAWQLSSSPLLRTIDPASGRMRTVVSQRGTVHDAWTNADGSRAVLDSSDDLRQRFLTVERGVVRRYRPPARLVAYDVALATTP